MTRRTKIGVAAAAVMFAALIGMQTVSGTSTSSGSSARLGPVYSSPESIRFAQDILVADGYLKPGSFKSGERDAATIEALRTFQQHHFLRANGLIDPDTMGVLTSHPHKVRIAAAPKPPAPAKVVERKPAPPEVKPAPKPAPPPPAPAPVVKKEEKVELAAKVEEKPVRKMPKTGSPAFLMLALGGLLIGSGGLLLFRARG